MVADVRRVIGAAGVFPHYRALVNKFNHARTFSDAFALRPLKDGRKAQLTNSFEKVEQNLAQTP